MKILIFLIILVIFCTGKIVGQGDAIKRSSSVYIELGGNMYSYSLNYDYKISHFGLRAGLNYFGGGMMRLAMLNFFIGRRINFIELGIGVINHTNISNTFPTMTFGYRYQGKRFIMKLAFTPLFATAYDTNQYIWPMAGFSAGYVFKSKK